MAGSGFAALGYQIVWTQQFGVWLGHEMVSVLAVVAAFFGGIALGAYALARRIDGSLHPARWYAGCEAVIAVWGLLLIWLMPLANPALAAMTGPEPAIWWQWSIAFVGPLLLLLPATAAMGATLPACARMLDRMRGSGFAIGGLYAANTLGAVLGVLGSAFVLIPLLGLSNTALLCAGVNLTCALAALAWRMPAPGTGAAEGDAVDNGGSAGKGGKRIGSRLFATGLLGIGHEVVVVRVLSQMTENTVYTFAVLLGVYLLGTAGGAAFYQRKLAGSADALALRKRLLCSLSVSMLAGMLVLSNGAALRALLATGFAAGLGGGFGAAIAQEAALALAMFALPSCIMGALFCHLCVEARIQGWRFGSALAINTVGAALAPLLCGVLLLPLLGPMWLLAAIAAGYLLLLPLPWRRWPAWAGVAGVAGAAALLGPLAFVDVPDGGHVVSYQDGVMAAVSVTEDSDGVRRLRINNRQQEGSSATGLVDARLAYLPLLLHAGSDTGSDTGAGAGGGHNARDALLLGLGTGVTAAAAAEDPRLRVDVVELLPEVIAAAAHFKAAYRGSPGAGEPAIIAADARRYVRASGKQYDVIVADLFHPARSGALYTVEHFAAIRARLKPGGLFCQWLPLHQLDLATLRSIVRSYQAVYPGAQAMLATNSLDTPVLGLIAHAGRAHLSQDRIEQRLSEPGSQARRSSLQLADGYALLGGFVAGPEALAHFASGAAANTDDRPTVAHRAPHATYAPEALPRERLLALLHALQSVPAWQLRPAQLLGAAENPAQAQWQLRLQAYWHARDRFLVIGMTVRPDPDPRIMLAQVRQPLLDMIRLSPDFKPARDPLLAMAQALTAIDGAAARALLLDVARAEASGNASLNASTNINTNINTNVSTKAARP